MKVIGERINSTRKSIKEAISSKDLDFLLKEAEQQIAAGANYIDINCAASLENEGSDLIWLIKEVRNRFGCGISIDSPDLKLIESLLDTLDVDKPFINSITAEEEKLQMLPSLFTKKDSFVIGLTIDDNGMPTDADGRINLAEKIINTAAENGIDKNNIYIDPLVKPVSTEAQQASYFLEAVKDLSAKGIKTIGGLSNASFGLPKRGILNAAFLKLCIDAGMDAFIIDPTAELSKRVLDGKELPREQFKLAEDTLLGKDAYAMNYIKAFRDGALNI
ncbi:MAG: dihydropteroate synthase [Candidatus Omnitrophica bacterium]|nr:dihydropteroate synthase [Candidatus Omnitrophota bacterium]